MDNEDDDDGNFTKWMSSYWGHGAVEDQARERKRSFVSPRSAAVGRRASLPCMSQLKHLHTATMDPPAETEVPARTHPHLVSADQTSWRKGYSPGDADSPIPGLSEPLEMLHLRKHRIMPLSGENNVCLMCREKLCNGRVTGGGGQDLRYSHRFHKEVKRPGEEGCSRRGRSTAVCEQRVEVDRKNITCHAINCPYGNNAD